MNYKNRFFAASLCAAVLLAACGDDDSDSAVATESSEDSDPAADTITSPVSSDTADTSSPTAEASEESADSQASSEATSSAESQVEPSPSGPVTVMAIGEVTSPTQAYPQGVEGLTAGFERHNATAAEAGLPTIEMEVCDTKGDPNEAANCARKAVEDEVDVVSMFFSTQSVQILPIMEAAGIAVLSHFVTPDQGTSPVSYPVTAGAVGTYGGLGMLAVDEGCTSIATLASDVAAFRGVVDLAVKAIDARGGTVVEQVFPAAGTPDYAPAVATAVGSGADCLLPVVPTSDTLKVTTAIAQSGNPDIRVYFAASAFGGVDTSGVRDGIVALNSFNPDPAVREDLIADHDEFAPDAPIDPFYTSGWVQAMIVSDAVGRVDGEVTSDLMKQALDASDPPFETGPTGPLDFSTPKTDNPAFARLFNTVSYRQDMVGGVLVPSADGLVDVADVLSAF